MNTVVTSKEEILKASRELIRQQGWSAVSIRSVAAACGVSVGSIYNYFDSKSALVGAAVESVWCEIFHRPENAAVFQDTQACVTWMYGRMAYGGRQYPGFFTLHSLGFLREERADGKRRMQQTWQHILDGLCAVLRQDAKVRAYRGAVRGCAVCPDGVRTAAAGLRSHRRAGADPQNAVLKFPPYGGILSPIY